MEYSAADWDTLPDGKIFRILQVTSYHCAHGKGTRYIARLMDSSRVIKKVKITHSLFNQIREMETQQWVYIVRSVLWGTTFAVDSMMQRDMIEEMCKVALCDCTVAVLH